MDSKNELYVNENNVNREKVEITQIIKVEVNEENEKEEVVYDNENFNKSPDHEEVEGDNKNLPEKQNIVETNVENLDEGDKINQNKENLKESIVISSEITREINPEVSGDYLNQLERATNEFIQEEKQLCNENMNPVDLEEKKEEVQGATVENVKNLNLESVKSEIFLPDIIPNVVEVAVDHDKVESVFEEKKQEEQQAFEELQQKNEGSNEVIVENNQENVELKNEVIVVNDIENKESNNELAHEKTENAEIFSEIKVEEINVETSELIIEEKPEDRAKTVVEETFEIKDKLSENKETIESDNLQKQEIYNYIETETKENNQNLNTTNEIPQTNKSEPIEQTITNNDTKSESPAIEKDPISENQNKSSVSYEKTFSELLERIQKFKQEGNEHIKNHSKKAEECYRQAIEEFETVRQTLNDQTLLNPDDISSWNNIIKEIKNVFSNLALFFERSKLYQEAINTDFRIITELDGRWDKSYLRLVKCFIELNQYDIARVYLQSFEKMFDDNTKSRHKEHIIAFKIKLDEVKEKEAQTKPEEKIEKDINNKPEVNVKQENVDKKDTKKSAENNKTVADNLNVSSASQGSTLVENAATKEVIAEQQVIKPAKKVNWIKAIFGSMFFVGCATGFYLLIRYRNKFR